MSLKNTPDSYGFMAKTFHWFIAFCIIGMLALGLVMSDMPPSPVKMTLYAFHKSTGVLVFVLVGLRFIWRLGNAVPSLPQSLAPWHRRIARSSPIVLYAFMFLLPLSGVLLSQAAGYPVPFYGLFTVPTLLAKNPDLSKIAATVHEYGAFLLMGVLSLHVAAALYHHFILKNSVLRRMLPSWFQRSPGT